MQIKKIVVGPIKTNCYILIKDDMCLIIDPGAEYDNIKKIVESLKIEGILITHYHFDHIGALNDFINKDNIKVYDYSNLNDNMVIGPFSFEIIRTPGHKEDAITYYFREDKIMFTGDFLFRDSIGRCDLAGSSEEDMAKSINLIKKYDNDIKIYPGHDEETTLGYEKKNNFYFQK